MNELRDAVSMLRAAAGWLGDPPASPNDAAVRLRTAADDLDAEGARLENQARNLRAENEDLREHLRRANDNFYEIAIMANRQRSGLKIARQYGMDREVLHAHIARELASWVDAGCVGDLPDAVTAELALLKPAP